MQCCWPLRIPSFIITGRHPWPIGRLVCVIVFLLCKVLRNRVGLLLSSHWIVKFKFFIFFHFLFFPFSFLLLLDYNWHNPSFSLFTFCLSRLFLLIFFFLHFCPLPFYVYSIFCNETSFVIWSLSLAQHASIFLSSHTIDLFHLFRRISFIFMLQFLFPSHEFPFHFNYLFLRRIINPLSPELLRLNLHFAVCVRSPYRETSVTVCRWNRITNRWNRLKCFVVSFEIQ